MPPLDPTCFRRVDESDDGHFYEQPRLVKHIDEPACAALAGFYGRTFPANGDLLDLMSSYASHLPETPTFGSVTGLGRNAAELAANPALTGRVIHDLNCAPNLPFVDDSFDGCAIAVSVQYLTNPIAVFGEVARVLKPGATFAVAFSNRMFPTKAIALWQALDDNGHGALVAHYMAEAGGFDEPQGEDLSPAPGASDPLFVVSATRSV
jgi:SAM-dependent methyltransferase